jgi:basic membrane protein A
MKEQQMRTRKLVLPILAGVMAVGLAACSSSGGGAPAPTAAPGTTADPTAEATVTTDPTGDAQETPAASGAALKIAIVTSPSGVDDGSFNQNNFEGAQAFVAANPDSSVTPVQEGDIARSVQAVQDIVADYDVIVTPGFQFAPIGDIATANPEKFFILVDTFPTDAAGATVELPNVYAMTFAEQESGFFGGIAAALETTSGKVAVLNGIAFPSNVHYQRGFEAGVNFANANLGASAEFVSLPSYAGTDVTGVNVGGNYVGDFNDPATGKVVADALIAEGVDIVLACAGASGNGAITSAKESGGALRVIGCDVDQWDDGDNNGSNVMLTSVLKVMDVQVERQLQAIADGTFTGGNVVLGAADDGTGFVSADGRHQLSADTVTALNDALDGVRSGSIVPPTGDPDTTDTPDSFPGL